MKISPEPAHIRDIDPGRIVYRNGLITSETNSKNEDFVIENGIVTECGVNLKGVFDSEVDLSGERVLPACIDPHVHFALPVGDLITSDDFVSGSRKALSGGVNTVFDFTTPVIGLTLEETVRRRISEAAEAECNVYLHAVVVGWNSEIEAQAQKCLELGIRSFKFFTTYAESKRMTSYEAIERAATWAFKHGARIIIHAEDNDSLIAAKNLPSDSFKFYESSRPVDAEVTAIKKIALIQQRTGAEIAIVHVSSGSGVAAAAGSNLKLETCPQYLTLTRDIFVTEPGWRYAVAPPLRSQAEQNLLWQAVSNGSIDWIGSDHAPFPIENYDAAGDHFTKTPFGLPGVDTLLTRMVMEGVMKNRITWEQLVSLTSVNAAKFYGIYPLFGSLKPGSRGEFTII